MPGVVFFDHSRRLHMTIDDETLGPGVSIRAVPWVAPERRWGPPTEVACTRLARLGDLSDDELGALEIPATAPGTHPSLALVRPLYPPGDSRPGQRR